MEDASPPIGIRWRARRVAGIVLASLAGTLACYADPHAALQQLEQARRLTADLRVQLHRAAEAEQRAVMADNERDAQVFAREASEANQALHADLATLGPLLDSLRYAEEQRALAEFRTLFERSEALGAELLALAAENSNVAAQRLAFGVGAELADRFCERLRAAAARVPEADALQAELLATRAAAAIREVQALQAPHVAEPDDAVMTRLEARMDQSLAAARAALAALDALVAPPVRGEIDAAKVDLDRFESVHREIVSLSRRNSDVRAFALALGRKRTSTAAGDAALVALAESLGRRQLGGTR